MKIMSILCDERIIFVKYLITLHTYQMVQCVFVELDVIFSRMYLILFRNYFQLLTWDI